MRFKCKNIIIDLYYFGINLATGKKFEILGTQAKKTGSKISKNYAIVHLGVFGEKNDQVQLSQLPSKVNKIDHDLLIQPEDLSS